LRQEGRSYTEIPKSIIEKKFYVWYSFKEREQIIKIMDRVERIVECLKKYEPEKIILFGSYIRGEMDEYSDLDFVVIKKTKKRFIRRLIEVAKLIDNNLGKIDIFVYTPEEFQRMIEDENPFIEQVLKEGRVVYEAK